MSESCAIYGKKMPHPLCPFLTIGKGLSTLKPKIARPSLVEWGQCKDATLGLKSKTLMLTLCVQRKNSTLLFYKICLFYDHFSCI